MSLNTLNFSHVTEIANIGDWIQSYRIVKKVGKGSFGPVFLGKSRKRFCAIKQVNRFVYLSECKNEAYMTNEVNINFVPFVVKYFGSAVIYNQMCIITKYAPGGNLREIAESRYGGTLSEYILNFYTLELIVCLRDMHKRGYLHLDLKPENVLVDKHGHVALADFGSAVSKITIEGQEKKYNLKLSEPLDWWSLAVLWLELAGGQKIVATPNMARAELYGSLTLTCPNTLLTGCSPSAREFVVDILSGNYQNLRKSNVKRHEYFKDVNWGKVKAKCYCDPPFIPNTTSLC